MFYSVPKTTKCSAFQHARFHYQLNANTQHDRLHTAWHLMQTCTQQLTMMTLHTNRVLLFKFSRMCFLVD